MPAAQFDADLAVFFDAAVFGTPATLGGVAVVGIVDAGFDHASLAGFGESGAGTSPAYLLASTSVPANPEGLSLVIASGPAAGNYRVTQVRPDATGVTTLQTVPV